MILGGGLGIFGLTLRHFITAEPARSLEAPSQEEIKILVLGVLGLGSETGRVFRIAPSGETHSPQQSWNSTSRPDEDTTCLLMAPSYICMVTL